MSYILFSINNNGQLGISSYNQYSLSGLLFNSYNNNTTYSNAATANALTFFSSNTPTYTGGTITTINFYGNTTVSNWSNLDNPTPVFTYASLKPQNIAVTFYGYFLATSSGMWTFTLGTSNSQSNDDVCALWVGSAGQTIENLKANATLANCSKSIIYTAVFPSNYSVTLVGGNFYPILFNYGQTAGGATIGLGITPPNGVMTYNGTPYFFH